jgi:hypothetical protein
MAGRRPGHLRASTCAVTSKDVDARDKRGHDEVDEPSPSWPGVVAAINGLTSCEARRGCPRQARAIMRRLDFHRHNLASSRPSTILTRYAKQGVDNSNKRGHDEMDGSTHIVMTGHRPGNLRASACAITSKDVDARDKRGH